ncbi:MAG TPA: MoaD/ThiS family protein [Acidothermaceae bacterium]|jgi:molybdopterin converting factor small subunit
MARVVVRYFAAARAAAGVDEETVDADTVRECLSMIEGNRGPGLQRVIRVCSLLLDGVQVRDLDRRLSGTVELDVLPPFAGG